MGFFSKLFKGDEDPAAAQPEAAEAPAQKRGDARSARPAPQRSPTAPTVEQPAQAKGRSPDAAAGPGPQATGAGTEEAVPPQPRTESPRPSPARSPLPAAPMEPKPGVAARAAAKAPAVAPPPLGGVPGRKPSSSSLDAAAAPNPERSAATGASAPRKPAPASADAGAVGARRNQTIREFPAVARPHANESPSRRVHDWASGPAVRIPASADESPRGAQPPPLMSADEPELAATPAAPRSADQSTLGASPALPTTAAEPETRAMPSPEPGAAPGEDDAGAIDRLLRAPAAARDQAAIEAERAADMRAAAETFEQLLAAGTAPLHDFMFQLSLGRTPPRWAAAAHAVIAPFLDGARQMELAELEGALAGLAAALERAAAEAGASISRESIDAIEQAYAELGRQLPNAFAAPELGDGRRLLMLESLLLQVPAMNRRSLDKLYGAGLGSLDRLCGAKAGEIAAVTGLGPELAEAIAERVRRFERERNGLDPAELRSQVRERLRAAVGRLAEQQDEFERAEAEASPARKRAARRAREATARELDFALAEIGELSLVEELKRCAVRSKIRRVESYLEQAQASAG